ncbi:MAG: hypothetical protein EVG15_08895 [Candidatus Acididesulfobacter diazotrophicus]|jgi:hypothetical protein|uniref:KAP NTPase domain-containing protein n=1 Tax=Candidatus Acididesulfobacter diazotrophicus TaxID=2597226 RepID=A0A519BKU5_9DELT|nr:MAG: hypothetical protein EVG15_08895 [Candidatus Acididesulfobacter diazotrophicus]
MSNDTEEIQIKLLTDAPSHDNTLGHFKNLAENLKKIIKILSDYKENNQENNINNTIGILGSWGSGKSTLIEMLKKEKDYEIFIFDSWSHKDDFIKRAFLIELVNFLDERIKKTFKGYSLKLISNIPYKFSEGTKEIDNKNDKKINSKITIGEYIKKSIKIIKSNSDPISNIKLLDKISILSLISLPFIISFIFSIFLKSITSNQSKIELTKYGLPATIVIIIILSLVITFAVIGIARFLFNKNSAIFLKKAETEESTSSAENFDFTNYDFQDVFTHILNKYKYTEYQKANPDKKLLIVFDNLDRVEDEAIIRCISLIQTIIESSKSSNIASDLLNNLYIVVPIDEERFKNAVGSVFGEYKKYSKEESIKTKNDVMRLIKEVLSPSANINAANIVNPYASNYINQNADLNYSESIYELEQAFTDRIFTYVLKIPDLESWVDFFQEKFNEVFQFEINEDSNKKLIEIKKEANHVIYIFWTCRKSTAKLTPREIKNFLNELAINYMYWENNSNDDINISIQALYVALSKYNAEYMKKIDFISENAINDDNINNLIDLVSSFINIDNNKIIEFLLMQKYKTEKASEIMNKYKFYNIVLKYINSNDDIDEAVKLIKVNGDQTKIQFFIQDLLAKYKNEIMQNLSILGNTYLVLNKFFSYQKEQNDFQKEIKRLIYYYLEEAINKSSSLNIVLNFIINEFSGEGISNLLMIKQDTKKSNKIMEKFFELVLSSQYNNFIINDLGDNQEKKEMFFKGLRIISSKMPLIKLLEEAKNELLKKNPDASSSGKNIKDCADTIKKELEKSLKRSLT